MNCWSKSLTGGRFRAILYKISCTLGLTVVVYELNPSCQSPGCIVIYLGELIMKPRILIVVVAVLGWSYPVAAATIHVPSDQPTIQAGIDAALEGDTVLVAPGIYTGDGNRDIDLGGKNIVVESSAGPGITIIDCQATPTDQHRGFWFHNGETRQAVVSGFTITGGLVAGAIFVPYPLGYGAGILCQGASPTIQNNIIRGNRAGSDDLPFPLNSGYGGGIFCLDGQPLIKGNVIAENRAHFSVGDDDDLPAPMGDGGGHLFGQQRRRDCQQYYRV